jgi:hypothetical protein
MASALFSMVKDTAVAGITSYAICRGFNQPNPFEKAVLTTVLVGLRELADAAIGHLRDDEFREQPLTRVLRASTILLAIPCSLYAGRVFNFKEADYLQIAGLASLGYTITFGLESLYNMFFPNKETE